MTSPAMDVCAAIIAGSSEITKVALEGILEVSDDNNFEYWQ